MGGQGKDGGEERDSQYQGIEGAEPEKEWMDRLIHNGLPVGRSSAT